MRKSLHDIKDIEKYLLGKMTAADRLVFEANIIVSPALRANVFLQRKVYSLVRWFGRRQQKDRLEAQFHSLMKDPDFSATIQTLFKIQ